MGQPLHLRGCCVGRFRCHYVFMHFVPSFLLSRVVRVTRIRESKRDRTERRSSLLSLLLPLHALAQGHPQGAFETVFVSIICDYVFM